MKFLCVIFWGFILTSLCHAQSWLDVSASAFTNAQIVWQVPSNALPKSLWVYRRELPHIFSASVISNAIVVGSLEKHGIPRPSTNDFYILPEMPPNWPGSIAPLFGMLSKDAYMYFSGTGLAPVSAKEIPDDKTIQKLARGYAPRLGVASAELTHGIFHDHTGDDDAPPTIYGRSVFFPRQLDGIDFFSADGSGDSAEGFSIEFGAHAKVQSFAVRWSNMQHSKNEPTASASEITRCIRSHKAIVMPNFRPDDFVMLKSLAGASRLTILKITPYYGEGVFGEVPTNDVPCKYAMPFAELEAVADVGSNHVPVKLLSPILSTEVNRLTKTK